LTGDPDAKQPHDRFVTIEIIIVDRGVIARRGQGVLGEVVGADAKLPASGTARHSINAKSRRLLLDTHRPDFTEFEFALRIMAREDRFNRRILGSLAREAQARALCHAGTYLVEVGRAG
jgi:hypothetical protein